MISPRLARRIAAVHRWLGLVVGLQLLLWTGTGLFFTAFAIGDVRGDKLVHSAAHSSVNMARVKLSSTDALAVVAEDRPSEVILRPLAGRPVYEVRAQIGIYVVSAETGEVMSPIAEDLAREIATAAWAGKGALEGMTLLDKASREAGLPGSVWAARFAGDGHPTLYLSATNGEVGPVRTDLWRTYDFLWSLHIMDYSGRENFNHPLIIAAAVLALSLVLFGIALVVHRFARRLASRGQAG